MELTDAHAAPALLPSEQNNIAVYKKALPSVVNITSSTVTYDFFYGAVPEQGQGSGFILNPKGDILTNYHVVSNAQNVEVTLYNKHQYKAKVLMTDKAHDLALLKIDATDLHPATLATSRNLQVGQLVYAIGNPFGLSGTMTRGIISSIRSIRGPMGNLISDAIQTDAAINPGNSGGPLLNSQGDVIGMNTMIDTGGGADQNAGIGFAIPIDEAKAALERLCPLWQSATARPWGFAACRSAPTSPASLDCPPFLEFWWNVPFLVDPPIMPAYLAASSKPISAIHPFSLAEI